MQGRLRYGPQSVPFLLHACSALKEIQLVYGQAPLTHASLQENSALYSLHGSKKEIRIIDVPGHPRLRGQFQEHLQNAKAVAFVVDANTISRDGAAVAESVSLRQLFELTHILFCLDTSIIYSMQLPPHRRRHHLLSLS